MATPNIDGILITWGDRLFFTPGNRSSGETKPRLSGDAASPPCCSHPPRIEATVVAARRR